jgi:hypothetical protein
MLREVINRTKRFDGKKYWLSSSSFKEGNKWFNCLYLHFAKEEFSFLDYPKIVPCDWGSQKKRFKYSESDVGKLDWHGGCTFYEESFHVELGKTFVKVGCDFQHLWDDAYMEGDCGLRILETQGKEIAEEFEQLYLRKMK